VSIKAGICRIFIAVIANDSITPGRGCQPPKVPNKI
jgi:hypothetical protein